MGLRDRLSRGRGRSGGRGRGRPGTVRTSDAADESHLLEFATTRHGVEGFVEPRTAISDVTMILVAHDGEWTRRRVPSVDWAHTFANQHGVPSYDAAVVGYPARMREYNRRQKQTDATPAAQPERQPERQPDHSADHQPNPLPDQ